MTDTRSDQPVGLDGVTRPATGGLDLGALDDTELVAAVAQRRGDALAEVFFRHGMSVHGLAFRLCGSRLAQAVTQDVFLSCWHTPGRFIPTRGSLASQLLADTHRRAVSLLRSGRPAGVGGTDAPSDHGGSWESTDGAHESPGALLAVLPESQRRAITLAYVAGFTCRQIAEAFHQSEAAVRRDIRVGLASLGAQDGSRHDGEAGTWSESAIV